MTDLPERIHVSPTHRPSSAYDLYVHEPPHESGTEYLRADHVAALLAEERRRALAEAYQAAHDATTHPSAYACREAIRALSDAPAREGDMTSLGQPVTFAYTNWRAETAQRTAVPKRLWFGTTEWHPEPGWLMTAYDLEKASDRDFALADCAFAPAREVTVREIRASELMRLSWDIDARADEVARNNLPVSAYNELRDVAKGIRALVPDDEKQAALRALSQGGEG